MAAKGNIPEFKTLKECLEFLEWLKERNGVQSSLANRLKRLLEKKYEKVNEQQIANGLSMFLGQVSNFHNRLCEKPATSRYTPDRTRDTLYALLQCIPKFLSVMYFLRYHVDKNFEKVGGGHWGGENFGMVAMYARLSMTLEQITKKATEIEKYFITQNDSMYGVIPGGFDPKELKQIGQGGYSEGRLMTDDLVGILDKERNPYNLFRDVFVMSVLSRNSGVDVSNIANALRMVEDFCGIFGAETNEGEFKSHIQSRGKCINWSELKQHCATLKTSVAQMYKPNRFSFTGYGRTYGYLDKKNIAKKMASWLKKNLPEITNILAQIKPLSTIKHFNSKMFQRRGGPPLNVQVEVADYFTKHLFRYGFTFEKNSFKTGTTPYEDLKKHWDSVIEMLKKERDGGLATLKKILDGSPCATKEKQKEPKPKRKPDSGRESDSGPELRAEPEDEPEPEDENDLESEDDVDVDSDEELMNQLSDEEDSAARNTEATKTEAAKPVVTKAEAPKPTATKQEGAQNQGEKAEGAQNQGKKAEGAQNQGKKAEGAQNQGKKANATPTEASPRSTPTQNSSVPSQVSQSPGAHDPSSGQDPGAQSASPVSTQQSSRGSHRDGNADASSSPGSGGSGGSGQPTPVEKCLVPTMATFFNVEDTEKSHQFCSKVFKKPTITNYKYDTISEKLWEEYKKREILQPWEEQLGKRKREKEDKEREKEEKRQLQREAMLPEIDVYRPPDVSATSTNAHLETIYNKVKYLTPKWPPSITVPPKYDAGNYDNLNAFDVDKSSYFDIVRPEAVDVAYPALFTIEQRAKENADGQIFLDGESVVGADGEEINELYEAAQAGFGGVPVEDIGVVEEPDNYRVDPEAKRMEDLYHKKLQDDIMKGVHDRIVMIQMEDEEKKQIEKDKKHAEDKFETSKQAYEDYQQSLDKYHQALTSLNGFEQKVVKSQTNDPRWLTDVDFAVYTTVDLDGKEIMDESRDTGKHEHQRNVQLAEYDKTVELQRDVKQQWEKYSQDQNVKATEVQKEHIQEVQRTLDAINHYKDVEYEKQRAAAESVTGLPIISKSISSLPQMPNYVNKPTFPMATGAPIRNPNPHSISIPTAMFLAEPQPTKALHIDVPDRPSPKVDDPEFLIEVAKRTLPDNDHDFDLDFDDDSTHIRDDTSPDFVDPSFPAISFSIPPPGPEQYLPPSNNPKINTVEFKDTCAPTWITKTPTPGSTDIPETELFPSEAPRTVRDMLTWLAGLRHPKHHDTLTQCINKAFSGLQSDPSQLALSVNGSHIRPGDVFDILQLTAMFAGSVLTSIAPNWRANLSSKTVKPKSSDQSEEPDPSVLLCQLRDYVYACCHQLQFLKSQCSRNELHGGWQDCKYGGDPKISSPLQSFLTDGWDCPFETHPFDPCNLCHKSRIRMGFKNNDLPEKSQHGGVISTILTPSCGDDVRGGRMVTTVVMALVINATITLSVTLNVSCQLCYCH